MNLASCLKDIFKTRLENIEDPLARKKSSQKPFTVLHGIVNNANTFQGPNAMQCIVKQRVRPRLEQWRDEEGL